MRTIDRRDDGYQLIEVGPSDELDVQALLAMVDEAWQLDYQGETRLVFDDTSLPRYLPAQDWLGVMALDERGAPVGFEVAMERVLFVAGEKLRCFYVSMLSVSAHHRRRGLGRWILEGINRAVFEDRGGDLIFSTFQLGHAGAPTVQATFDDISDWGVLHFQGSPIWSRRLDRDPLAPLEDPLEWRSLSVETSETGAHEEGDHQESDHEESDHEEAVQLIDEDQLSALESWICGAHSVAFGLGASVRSQYLSPGVGPASGLFLYSLGNGRQALVGWYVVGLAIDDHRLRPVGQVQMMALAEAEEDEREHILRHLAEHFVSHGCFAMSVVDAGVSVERALESLGFERTGDDMAFAVRGPMERLAAFASAEAPYWVDFT